MHFSLSPTSNYTDIFQMTQEGLLITKANQLKPKQRHNLEVKRFQVEAKNCSSAYVTGHDINQLCYILKVMAVDQESGDATFTTVVVDVLSAGQAGKNMVVKSLLMTY